MDGSLGFSCHGDVPEPVRDFLDVERRAVILQRENNLCHYYREQAPSMTDFTPPTGREAHGDIVFLLAISTRSQSTDHSRHSQAPHFGSRPKHPLVGRWHPSRGRSFECCLRFDISLGAPLDRQEQVGGWEFFLHRINKAVCIFGCFEFFLKNQ